MGECKQKSAGRELPALFGWLGKIKDGNFLEIRSFGIRVQNFHILIYLVERHEPIVDLQRHCGHSCRIESTTDIAVEVRKKPASGLVPMLLLRPN